MKQIKLFSEKIDALQRQTFDDFVYEVNSLNALVADSPQEAALASIAAVGLVRQSSYLIRGLSRAGWSGGWGDGSVDPDVGGLMSPIKVQ